MQDSPGASSSVLKETDSSPGCPDSKRMKMTNGEKSMVKCEKNSQPQQSPLSMTPATSVAIGLRSKEKVCLVMANNKEGKSPVKGEKSSSSQAQVSSDQLQQLLGNAAGKAKSSYSPAKTNKTTQVTTPNTKYSTSKLINVSVNVLKTPTDAKCDKPAQVQVVEPSTGKFDCIVTSLPVPIPAVPVESVYSSPSASPTKGRNDIKKSLANSNAVAIANEIVDSEVEKIALDAEIDKVLDEKAAKNNLTAINVKSIIYQVISNNMVKKMYLNTIKRERRQKVNNGEAIDEEEDDFLLFEPKLTRSRAKELFSKRRSTSSASIKCSEEKPGTSSDSTGAVMVSEGLDMMEEDSHFVLLAKDLPDLDDPEDDEYIPSLRDTSQVSDDECNSSVASFASDIGSPAMSSSQPSTPLNISSPRRRTRRSVVSAELADTPEKTPTKTDCLSQDDLFKTPKAPLEKTTKGSREADDLAIGLRTRSKLPLNDTPLEHFESQFIPPDITTDMYDWDDTDNEDYLDFLKSCWSLPNKTDVPKTADEDEEEGDPEYNVMEDEDEEKHDLEELRDDRAVKIPKKELESLVSELYETFPVSGSDNGMNWEEMLGLKNPETDSSDANPRHVTTNEKESRDVASAGNEGSGLPNMNNVNENLNTNLENLKSNELANVTSDSIKNADSGADQAQHKVVEDRNLATNPVIPAISAVELYDNRSAPTQQSTFTTEQMQQLQDQMRKHIQLLAQSVVLNDSVDKNASTTAKGMINEIWHNSQIRGPNSVLSVCNLKPAVEFTDQCVQERSRTPLKKILEQRVINGEVEYSLNGYPRHVLRSMITSEAFCYPELLPRRFGSTSKGFFGSENDSLESNSTIKKYYTKSEDAILIYELDYLRDKKLTIGEQAQFLAENLPLKKTLRQIYNRIRNLHKSKHKVFQDYQSRGILPTPSDQITFFPCEPLALVSKPIHRIPKLWRRLMHEARQPVITIAIPHNFLTTQGINNLNSRICENDTIQIIEIEDRQSSEETAYSCARLIPFTKRKTPSAQENKNWNAKRFNDNFDGCEVFQSDYDADEEHEDEYEEDEIDGQSNALCIDLCSDSDLSKKSSDGESEGHFTTSTTLSPSSSDETSNNGSLNDLNFPCVKYGHYKHGRTNEQSKGSKSNKAEHKKGESSKNDNKNTCDASVSSVIPALPVQVPGEGEDDDDDSKKLPGSFNNIQRSYDAHDTDSQHEEADDETDGAEAKKLSESDKDKKKKPRQRKRKLSKSSPKTKVTRRNFKYNTTPLEQLLDDAPVSTLKSTGDQSSSINVPTGDDIQTAFVDAFLSRVKQQIEVEGKNPGLFSSFLQILEEYDKSENEWSQKDLFLKVESLLKDHPDVVKEFVAILDAEVASELGYFTEHKQGRTYQAFLEYLEKWTEKCPQLKAKIIHKCRVLREDSNLTKDKVIAVIDTYFDQNQLLIELFKAIFPQFFRPEVGSGRYEFEEIELDMEDKPSTDSSETLSQRIETGDSKMGSALDAEFIRLPEELNPVASSTCPCPCHENSTNSQYRNRVKHCTKCRLKFQDGKVYAHARRGVKPVSVKYTFPAIAKQILEGRACLTCLKPNPNGSVVSSNSNSNNIASCSLTDSATATTSTTSKPTASPPSTSQSERPWTKEEDRLILTTWQGESSWSDTLTKLQLVFTDRTKEEIKHRTLYLMKILEAVTKTN